MGSALSEKEKMKKIQFDTISGVVEVQDFDEGVTMVKQSIVFECLKTCEDGEVCGCEVDDATFAKIAEEYGVK